MTHPTSWTKKTKEEIAAIVTPKPQNPLRKILE
jgi:hypothetical protein